MDYVVTGIGIINGLGESAEESWINLLAGKSAIKTIKWPDDDPTRFPSSCNKILKIQIGALNPHISENYPHPIHFDYGWNNWDTNTRACLLTVDEAITDSKLISKNVGVVVSTFGSGTTLRLDMFSNMMNGIKKTPPRKVLNTGLDFPAAQVAAAYKVTGPNTAMDSACTTGITSIDYAINTLKANPDLDAMIVGAADHMAEPIYMYWFQNLGALSPTGSRPFDKSRNGFVMGEGAATMIIEPKNKALARGAKIYGTIKSCSFVTLFDSDTSPDPEGHGAKRCVQQALDRAGITADQIRYINAHATSTPVGDQIEYDAMLALTPNQIMVSNKGQIGHCMSAAGIVESIYTLLALRDQRTPGNANLVDACSQGMILPNTAIDIDARYAIKNSFGFGGRNASIVFERYVG